MPACLACVNARRVCDAPQWQTKRGRQNPYWYDVELQTSSIFNIFPGHVLPPRPPSAGVAPWLRAGLTAPPQDNFSSQDRRGLQCLLSTTTVGQLGADSAENRLKPLLSCGWPAMSCGLPHVCMFAKLSWRPGGLAEQPKAPHDDGLHVLCRIKQGRQRIRKRKHAHVLLILVSSLSARYTRNVHPVAETGLPM